jgi:hypothetical protein
MLDNLLPRNVPFAAMMVAVGSKLFLFAKTKSRYIHVLDTGLSIISLS